MKLWSQSIALATVLALCICSAPLAAETSNTDRCIQVSLLGGLTAAIAAFVAAELVSAGLIVTGYILYENSDHKRLSPRCNLVTRPIPLGTVYACPTANMTVAATFSDPAGNCPADKSYLFQNGGGGYGDVFCTSLPQSVVYNLENMTLAMNDDAGSLTRHITVRDDQLYVAGIVLMSVFGCIFVTINGVAAGLIGGGGSTFWFW